MKEHDERRIPVAGTAGQREVRIAIVGCGAVAEVCHLPAAEATPEVKVVALVDTNLERARTLGKQFDIKTCLGGIHEMPPDVEGVIVAVPNHLHAPLVMQLLRQKMPVLVEKPLALTENDAKAMVAEAKAGGVVLQVGLMYRFFKGAILMKRAVQEGWLGPIKSFQLESGIVYDWPATSDFIVRKDQAGGGELVDVGSHMLDLLLWWIGDVEDVRYKDDSQGGVEADCEMTLTLRGPGGPVEGRVALSRLRKLTDTARIVGENLTIECDLASRDRVRVWPTGWKDQTVAFASEFSGSGTQSWNEVFSDQLRSFGRAIRSGTGTFIQGGEVISTVGLIERCYRERHAMTFPWMENDRSEREGVRQ
jgi:predicted dehydrogenase